MKVNESLNEESGGVSHDDIRSACCSWRIQISKSTKMRRLLLKISGNSASVRRLRLPRHSVAFSSSSSSSSSSSLWGRYSDLLEAYPLPTKVVTSGVISFSGDLISQSVISGENFDFPRCVRYTTAGALLVGPVLHFWYAFLNRAIPGASLMKNLKRLLLDQLLFSPCFTCVFISSLSIIGEGKSVVHTIRKLRQDFFTIVLNGWIIWCPAQFINFTFIPSKFQVLYSNMIGLLWNIYLSHASARQVAELRTDVKVHKNVEVSDGT